MICMKKLPFFQKQIYYVDIRTIQLQQKVNEFLVNKHYKYGVTRLDNTPKKYSQSLD